MAVRRSVWETPLSLCKIPAKSVQQFRRRRIPNIQTERQTAKQMQYWEITFHVQVATKLTAAGTIINLVRSHFSNRLSNVLQATTQSQHLTVLCGRRTPLQCLMVEQLITVHNYLCLHTNSTQSSFTYAIISTAAVKLLCFS